MSDQPSEKSRREKSLPAVPDRRPPQHVEAEPVPKPSYLPSNPSVGELVTEIDRARHDAAHTIEALVEKLDVKARVREKTRSQVADLQVKRQQLMDSAPESVAKALGVAGGYAKRIPMPVGVGIVVVLLFLLRRRRKH
ncbi:MAG TPA: DUF3618 domain-containing protein [Pseudonocardiaceae bacterium]|jgi:hypothetical protein|nr:DUF3618 domain-containing protein [Pseudonocardiaceae bacterium]